MNGIETQGYASVWDAIGDTPEQAANLAPGPAGPDVGVDLLLYQEHEYAQRS